MRLDRRNFLKALAAIGLSPVLLAKLASKIAETTTLEACGESTQAIMAEVIAAQKWQSAWFRGFVLMSPDLYMELSSSKQPSKKDNPNLWGEVSAAYIGVLCADNTFAAFPVYLSSALDPGTFVLVDEDSDTVLCYQMK